MKNEHVGIIEPSICTIKEVERKTRPALPFKIYKSIIYKITNRGSNILPEQVPIQISSV